MKEEKKDLRVVKTKNTLYNTLEDLMKTMSFEDIKVSDICNKALINRSTFYSHYSDKYELFTEYLNNLRESLTEELDKNKNIKNTKEYYLELIKLLLNHIEEKKETYLAIVINNQNSIAMNIFNDVIDKTVINELIDKNNINDIVYKFYVGGVINVCVSWLYDNKYSKEEIIKYIDMLIPNDLYIK